MAKLVQAYASGEDRSGYASTWLPLLTTEAAQTWRNEDRPATYVAARGLGFWVVEVEGKVAGFVDWDGDFVNALHVSSTNVRMGLGSGLMDKAEAAYASGEDLSGLGPVSGRRQVPGEWPMDFRGALTGQ